MAGLLQLFMNPAGWMDKMGEKVSDRAGFLDSIMDKAQTAKGLQGKAGEFIQEATGIGPVREKLLDTIGQISNREIPGAPEDEDGVLDRKKFLGISAGEWMARVGSGLMAAGGGNGSAVMQNYLNKESAKDARRASQRDARQQALQARDDDVLRALGDLDSTMTQAQSSSAGQLLSAGTSLENKATDAAMSVMHEESQDARQLVGIQADYTESRRRHIERLQEMDFGAELRTEEINHTAALNLRNEKMAELTALGLNPAAMAETVNKYSTGDFEGMTPQDHARLRMWQNVANARTDEERRAAILSSISNVIGTKVHARDQLSGDYLYSTIDGSPVYTNIGTAEGAMKYVLGDQQSALDSITANPIQAEIDAQTQFYENSGLVSPSPRHQTGRNPNAFSEQLGGFPSTQDAVREQMGPDAVTGDRLREQQRQLGPLVDNVTSDFEAGATMLDVMVGLKKAKMAPEIIQVVMQKAMEFGYWDGQEDRERIELLMRMGPNVHPSAYEQP